MKTSFSKQSISIKELHANTGHYLGKVSKSRKPVTVTDRGEPIDFLIATHLFQPRQRERTLLPQYRNLLSKKVSNDDVLEDLNAIRGDR